MTNDNRPIPATELLDTADLMVSIEEQRARLGGILAATAEALRLPLGDDFNGVPAAAAAVYDTARNLREQLNRVTTGRQRLQEQLDDMTATAAGFATERDEAIEARDVLRHQLTTEKVRVDALRAELATAHNALRNLAQAYADTAPGATEPAAAEQGCDDCSVEPGERHRYTGCPGNERAAAARAQGVINGLLANVGRSLASAANDAERAESIEMLLDGWYAAWPDSGVTDPHAPLAAELVRLLGRREPVGIRPADWEQRAIEAAHAGLGDAWSMLATDPTAARRLAAAAVRAIIDAGLAGDGGRCRRCGSGFPRTLPADQDRLCWTCDNEEQVGLDEYTDGAPGDPAAARRLLDRAIDAALPKAGGKVRKLLKALRRELAEVDANRAYVAIKQVAARAEVAAQ